MRQYLGEIGLVITAIIWGSGFVASAVSLEYYTPYQILAGRFLIGVILLSLIFYKKLKKMHLMIQNFVIFHLKIIPEIHQLE